MARPKPPPSKVRVPITLTLPRDVMKQLETMANQEERTRSKLVELAVRKYVATSIKAVA